MIQTVTGWIENSQVERVLPHEHILCDLRKLVAPLDNGIFYDKVALSNYGALSRNPYAVLDNAVLDDRQTAISEMEGLMNVGFNLIADATTSDFGRDIHFFRELTEKTGIHIVAGTGSYTDAAVSAEFKSKSVAEMRQIILDELLVGINGTRLFSVLYHRTLNVGRVLSPTLALVVQREAEIEAFKPEPFYTVNLSLNGFTAVRSSRTRSKRKN